MPATARIGIPLGLSAVLMLTACTDLSKLPPAPLVPGPVEMSYVLPSYRIQVSDVLDIRLILAPELNEEVTVRPDGHISTTIATDLPAAGLTVPELDAELVQAYSQDLSHPRISVIVKTFAPTRVYVAGEVATPGEQNIQGNAPTLAQAIARAGGTKLSSDEHNVFIIRHRPNQAPQFLSTRFDALTHAQDASADVQLAPFDVVYVPKSGIAEVYKWYNQYIQQFANPNFNFSFFLNPSNAASNVVNVP